LFLWSFDEADVHKVESQHGLCWFVGAHYGRPESCTQKQLIFHRLRFLRTGSQRVIGRACYIGQIITPITVGKTNSLETHSLTVDTNLQLCLF
jgi:hypothetical protein